jgi:hypothetical protein
MLSRCAPRVQRHGRRQTAFDAARCRSRAGAGNIECCPVIVGAGRLAALPTGCLTDDWVALAQERLASRAFTAFGGIALLLAALVWSREARAFASLRFAPTRAATPTKADSASFLDRNAPRHPGVSAVVITSCTTGCSRSAGGPERPRGRASVFGAGVDPAAGGLFECAQRSVTASASIRVNPRSSALSSSRASASTRAARCGRCRPRGTSGSHTTAD